ncbi:MAG TPA: hypothetical protein VIG24_16120 [Acidimicrobiia bacterium]
MTQEIDPVAEALNAYFEHLENGAPKPSLDHLTPAQRAEAEELIQLLDAGRGIDPEASRPSLAALLDRHPARHEMGAIADAASTLQSELRHRVEESCTVNRDVAAHALGITSDLLVVCRGHRIRVILEADPATLDELTPRRIGAIAGVFGAFADTAAVLLATTPSLDGVVIEPQDIEPAVETPRGQVHPAHIRRPVTDAATACAAFISELVPSFVTLAPEELLQVEAPVIDFAAIATRCIDSVAQRGSRAQIEAKRTAWLALGETEASWLTTLVSDLADESPGSEDLEGRLNTIVRTPAA